MPFIKFDGQKVWVPSMSPKGTEIYMHHRRITLLHGPRKTTKSNVCQNMLVQHCFRWPGACAAIIVKGLNASVGSGCWEQITGALGILQQQWFPAGIGCSWAPGGEPRMLSDTKMRTCKIMNNQTGGVSEIQLHTLPLEKKVDKFKDSNFSFIYLVEADRWTAEDVMDTLVLQLRGDEKRIPHAFREVVLDCNPPRIGQKHWLYRRFIRDENGKYPPDMRPDLMEVKFTMDDNPFITPAEKQEIYESNKADSVELDRNWHGIWIQSRKGTCFREQFEPSRHVIGDSTSPDPAEHTVLLPPPGTFDFPTGWDLGDAMNHAAVIACKIVDAKGRPTILFIDEIVRTNKNYSIPDFARDFLQRMDYWEAIMKRRLSPILQWRYWSDTSSLRYLAAADGSAATSIMVESEGRITLRGVKKQGKSVNTRVQILKRALFQGQILISASCTHCIQMLEEIPTDENGEIDAHDPQKHILDAMTYLLQNELPIFNEPEPVEERIVSI